MLAEADVFVQAERMLVEVLGRIREADAGLLLPDLVPGSAPGGDTLAQAVARHARDDARVPHALGYPPAADGEGPHREGTDGEGADGQHLARLAAAACAAAARVEDGDRVVPAAGGGLPVRQYLLRAAVRRSLLAHYVAARLGSTACPLPEELARPLRELTEPDVAAWRALGWFQEPMPLPPYVSQRDRFLLSAGHAPHPYGH